MSTLATGLPNERVCESTTHNQPSQRQCFSPSNGAYRDSCPLPRCAIKWATAVGAPMPHAPPTRNACRMRTMGSYLPSATREHDQGRINGCSPHLSSSQKSPHRSPSHFGLRGPSWSSPQSRVPCRPQRPRLYDVSIPLGSRSGMNEWLILWPLSSLTLIDVWVLTRWRAFDGVCVLWTWRRASSIASCGRRDSRFLYEAKRECHSRPKRKPPSDPLQITWGPTSLPTPNSIGRISSAAA